MPKNTWEGKELKGWTVHERLGSGGNGDVHRATRADQQGAIKILKSDLWTGKRYERFKHEIEGMQRCKGIPGVIPLLDFNAPEKPAKFLFEDRIFGHIEDLCSPGSKRADRARAVAARLGFVIGDHLDAGARDSGGKPA